jgi:hypothetical protein
MHVAEAVLAATQICHSRLYVATHSHIAVHDAWSFEQIAVLRYRLLHMAQRSAAPMAPLAGLGICGSAGTPSAHGHTSPHRSLLVALQDGTVIVYSLLGEG